MYSIETDGQLYAWCYQMLSQYPSYPIMNAYSYMLFSLYGTVSNINSQNLYVLKI